MLCLGVSQIVNLKEEVSITVHGLLPVSGVDYYKSGTGWVGLFWRFARRRECFLSIIFVELAYGLLFRVDSAIGARPPKVVQLKILDSFFSNSDNFFSLYKSIP